jgi:hypothetical protein
MIKLCVGITSVKHLQEVRKQRIERGEGRSDGLVLHRTRMMPRRRDEIIGKGSLYWVIAGKVQCRQLIVDLEPTTDIEGKKYCNILMQPKIIHTIPQPKKAFQGWRYLPLNDAPDDLDGNIDEASTKIAAELAALGLI